MKHGALKVDELQSRTEKSRSCRSVLLIHYRLLNVRPSHCNCTTSKLLPRRTQSSAKRRIRLHLTACKTTKENGMYRIAVRYSGHTLSETIIETFMAVIASDNISFRRHYFYFW